MKIRVGERARVRVEVSIRVEKRRGPIRNKIKESASSSRRFSAATGGRQLLRVEG
jgi:hypothetical protein